MGKVERKDIDTTDAQYARVMHHIGGLTGKNDNSDMVRGGEDELNLLQRADLAEMAESDVKRLFELGALRPATPAEIKQWKVKQGIEVAEDEDAATAFTTGNETLKADQGKTGAVKTGGGAEDDDDANGDNDTAPTYKGMGKGELSEYTVPELKIMAKDEGVEGAAEMLKPELLDTLLNLGK